MKFRKWVLNAALACLAVFIIGFTALFLRKNTSKPLGEGPRIEYPSGSTAQSNAQQFFEDRFSPINDVQNLPVPVLRAFTEEGSTRLVIANPGKDFTVGDVVYDETLPSKRLIFAGVSGEKCFVHYEQGGRGHMYLVALFKASNDSMTPVWRGFCRGRAKSIEELRSWLHDGGCQSPILGSWR
jgi:hypothetical protein